MSFRVEHVRGVLGPTLDRLWAGAEACQRQISCVTVVDDLSESRECRSGELILVVPSGSAAGRVLDLMDAVAARQASLVLIPDTVLPLSSHNHVARVSADRGIAAGLLAANADLRQTANRLSRALGVMRTEGTASILHGADTLQALAEALGHLVGNSVTIETPQHELLAFTPAGVDVDRVREETILHRRGSTPVLTWIDRQGYMTQLRKATRPLKIPGNPELRFSGRIAMRIASEGELLGIIWVTDTARALGERDYAVIEQAADAAAAILVQQRAAAQREAELRAEFLDDVVHGRISAPENMRTLAHSLGWDFDRLRQALVVSIDDFEAFRLRHTGQAGRRLQRAREQLIEVVRLEAMAVDPEAVVGPRRTGVLILFNTGDADPGMRKTLALRLADRIVKAVAALIPDTTVTVGVGRDFPSFEHMAESFRQAQVAAQLGASLWSGNRAMHYDDLGVHRVLFALREHEGIVPPALQRVIEHDAHHRTDYVRTLATYFACMGRLRAAANQLGIHRNTLEYRMGRIGELAGFSLDDPNNRLALELGIRLLELKRSTDDGITCD